MRKYLVTMYNEFGCALYSGVVVADSEDDAIQKWVSIKTPIIYSRDSFIAEEYWDQFFESGL